MLRVASSELRQVFRAYTKQLRGEYAKASKGESVRQTRARGFERVEISEEAKALAASGMTVHRSEQPTTEKTSHKQTNAKDGDNGKKKTEKQQAEGADAPTGVQPD